MKILVTGSKGMIGSRLVATLLERGYEVVGVDRVGEEGKNGAYYHYKVELSDLERLNMIITENDVDKVIHLAALAHTEGEADLSWERYKYVNVDCSKNVFTAAGNRPVLFISTIDVFGFYDGKVPVNGRSRIKPVSKYGKSKALAEKECRKLKYFTIFRLSPVYTDEIKRDIQKRYYLKYPHIAYRIGKGSQYEILNVNRAVQAMAVWCENKPANNVMIIKDENSMWTPDYIKAEKACGRANVVLVFPRIIVNLGYLILKHIFGENEKTYLLNKAIHPLKSE